MKRPAKIRSAIKRLASQRNPLAVPSPTGFVLTVFSLAAVWLAGVSARESCAQQLRLHRDALLEAQAGERRVERARFDRLERADALLGEELRGRGRDRLSCGGRRHFAMGSDLHTDLRLQLCDLLFGGFQLAQQLVSTAATIFCTSPLRALSRSSSIATVRSKSDAAASMRIAMRSKFSLSVPM